MAWCCQASSHYLNQCWPRSLLPYGVTRPQWVKSLAQINVICWHLGKRWITERLNCGLFGPKPLPEAKLNYCQPRPWKQISVKFWWKHNHFQSRECIWKCPVGHGGHLVWALVSENKKKQFPQSIQSSYDPINFLLKIPHSSPLSMRYGGVLWKFLM